MEEGKLKKQAYFNKKEKVEEVVEEFQPRNVSTRCKSHEQKSNIKAKEVSEIMKNLTIFHYVDNSNIP